VEVKSHSQILGAIDDADGPADRRDLAENQ
jgi:hypothetical protein